MLCCLCCLLALLYGRSETLSYFEIYLENMVSYVRRRLKKVLHIASDFLDFVDG